MGTATATHAVYRLADGKAVKVGEFTRDITWYQLSEPASCVAEQALTEWWLSQAQLPGDFRIEVRSTFSGGHLVTIERPMPLPAKWAALSPWHSAQTGRPSRFFADNVLKLYPGTTVHVVGEHLEVFGEHYAGTITTAELAARTGYQLPPDARRPHYPPTSIDPATDLAVSDS